MRRSRIDTGVDKNEVTFTKHARSRVKVTGVIDTGDQIGCAIMPKREAIGIEIALRLFES